ncbi:type IV toxin-antitoxin system AbiEi family antitoxin domain-containing protein [Nocardia grenadensis]|uniref:type IV toxin-antitoxin system AbiEi family antitoxin domain-containing protein n=1 Tax=Nocardia grenadensis TaxID=931537 RepID=UPI0009FBB046|nr:type IV toxin-antitoxin system AbiEi family antitoxin domain-containing protein [Nocardia grenadensis]
MVVLRARLAALAESQWGLLTTAQAATVGANTKQLQRLVEHGVLARLRYGVYRLAGVPDSPVEPLRAEWLALEPARTVGDRIGDDVPIGIVSHRSAADLHRLGDLDADYLEFTVTARRGTRSPDVRFHRAALTPGDWTLVDGLPVTTPARTIADLAATRTDGGHLASVVRDALLQGTSGDDIAAALRPYAHRYGAPVDNGSALVNHFITLAGVPESSLALSAPALEPVVAASLATNKALEQLLHGHSSTHLTASLTSMPTDAAVAAIRNQLTHSVPSEQITLLVRQALAPLVESGEWRDMMARLRTRIAHSLDPQHFTSPAAIEEATNMLLRTSISDALLDTTAAPTGSSSEAEK